MTTGDVVYSLRFSLIKILPEPGFDLGSTAGESCVLTVRLHMLCMYGINSELYRENIILFGNMYFSLFMIPIVFDNFMHTKFV